MSIYSKLARQAAEHFVKYQETLPEPSYYAPELERQRACFVTIFEKPGHRVRALYGNALPRQHTLAQEIIANTIAALEANPSRHISRPDLASFSYSVALLGPLQRVSDPHHLDPLVFGLYVRSDRSKSAILLPQRAGIETADDQIATALRESGIKSRDEAVSMYRFEVEYHDG